MKLISEPKSVCISFLWSIFSFLTQFTSPVLQFFDSVFQVLIPVSSVFKSLCEIYKNPVWCFSNLHINTPMLQIKTNHVFMFLILVTSRLRLSHMIFFSENKFLNALFLKMDNKDNKTRGFDFFPGTRETTEQSKS